MDPRISVLFACPACHGELRWDGDQGVCRVCGSAYRMDDGVPHFIEARRDSAGGRRFAGLAENERLYDFIQRALGYPKAARHLQAVLGDTAGRVVLDVGGGTGNIIPFLSSETTYVCLDNDIGKLERLRAKRPTTPAVLADATRLPFGDNTIDDAVCVAVTHHLADEGVVALADELARVVRDRVVVFDPVLERKSRRGRLLWRIDRGSFPRTASALSSLLGRRLRCAHAARFSIHHHYMLWVGGPLENSSVTT